MAPVVVVGPSDSFTALLVERLAAVPAVADEALPGADVEGVVYRPSLTAARDNRPDLAEADRFAEACLEALSHRALRIVLLSSTAAHPPSHHNVGYLGEDEKLPTDHPLAGAWRELERRVGGRLAEAGAEVVVLRPAPVAIRDGQDHLCRLLRAKVAVVPAGYDPALQILHPEDLVEAVRCALERGHGGLYHVAPAGVVPVRGALRFAGTRRVPVVSGLQRPVRALASRLGWSDPPAQLDVLRHSFTVSGRKIERELGFVPRKTSAEAVRDAFGRGEGPLPDFDPFGMDERYIDAYGRTLFRFLHDRYWRIEHQGLENVPRQGKAVLTGVHRGFMPWDGVMALHLLRRETGRIPRFLIHPCLIKLPFLANYMTKLGGLIACQENADWVLEREGLLGMFPEGIGGAFTMYRDAYKLGRFGRDEYVKMALRNRAPIVPFVTVGSAEIYPILFRVNSKLVRRVLEWPFLPITPTFPLPGLPLPSKWHTRFLEPIPVHEEHPPEAADDPQTVHRISAEVRARMEGAIREMLERRRSVFFGSIFERPQAPPPVLMTIRHRESMQSAMTMKPFPGRSHMRWRRLDVPGREEAFVEQTTEGWRLTGELEAEEAGVHAQLLYVIDCERDWRTRRAVITGSASGAPVRFEFAADGEGRWTLNGAPLPLVEGALDIDLGFTPATNLLPIRRLDLAVGERVDVRTAWLRFPELRVETLEQSYQREADRVFRYNALVDGEPFQARLDTDEHGRVLLYEGLWEADDVDVRRALLPGA